MEGKSEGRSGGSHRNRNLKVNIREVGRKSWGGVPTIDAEDEEQERDDMLGKERALN